MKTPFTCDYINYDLRNVSTTVTSLDICLFIKIGYGMRIEDVDVYST